MCPSTRTRHQKWKVIQLARQRLDSQGGAYDKWARRFCETIHIQMHTVDQYDTIMYSKSIRYINMIYLAQRSICINAASTPTNQKFTWKLQRNQHGTVWSSPIRSFLFEAHGVFAQFEDHAVSNHHQPWGSEEWRGCGDGRSGQGEAVFRRFKMSFITWQFQCHKWFEWSKWSSKL